jgi:multisubunit Na+/H+ antiporter MnhG subunit
MKRVLIGALLVLHGLAHTGVGVWAAGRSRYSIWLVSLLWGTAMLGYLAAGFGVLRAPLVRERWKGITVLATIASIVLLLGLGDTFMIVGMCIDVAILVLALGRAQPAIDAAIDTVDRIGVKGLPHPIWHRIGWGAALLFLVYAAALVVMRPWYLRWGTTAAERARTLPGDSLAPNAIYRVDHAITIHAPAEAVWPWLVQIGQDRGGFYSYDWLERLVGDDIVNAERVHPEWQALRPGDLVRAVQPNYLGGVFGPDVGWRVTLVEPGRAFVLDKWGAFVLEPVDTAHTRLIVRTRGEGAPTLFGMVFGPVNVFVFEPAHWIMQRGMLRGIRDRAERGYTTVASTLR